MLLTAIITVLVQVTLLSSIIDIWITFSPLSLSLFTLHIVAMGVGILILLLFCRINLKAIILCSNAISLMQMTKSFKYHRLFQLAMIACTIIGFSAIYLNKESNNQPHFTSWHSLSGGIACFLVNMVGFSQILLPRYDIIYQIAVHI